MPVWYYSTEPMPAEHLMNKPGYTPEIPSFFGINLLIKAKEWVKLPEYYPMLRHKDWMDKRGQAERIYSDEIIKGLRPQLEKRGVIFLDHEPTQAERDTLPAVSKELNDEFRADVIKSFEEQIREKELTGKGRTKPTPYEDECYTMLDLEKPYSPEALRNSRDPGNAAAKKIAEAIHGALAAERESLLRTKVEVKQKSA